MDDLRGPNIQIVLHVKEGLGFGFLRTPFIVSGSLNGYMLETDPVVPIHAPIFDAELVWEADKRRFRSLRVQNVPVKIEVFTLGTQGHKDKVGYLLLSLLGAQPCPSDKFVDVKHTWHKLLGVKSEGKCCHPQLLMSLSIEDRISTPTPRNELRMFHSNEVAYPSTNSARNLPMDKSMLLTWNEYIEESKKNVCSPDLQPKLMCDEGLIKIGNGKEMFVLSFVIGAVENIDLLLHGDSKDTVDCSVTYSVFSNNIMTDRVGLTQVHGKESASVHFNQRTSLRLNTDLRSLGRYFNECPHLVIKICTGDNDIGICSMDLRKLIPTEDTKQFLDKFCNSYKALTISERCFILPSEHTHTESKEQRQRDRTRKPFVDVEMSFRYCGVKQDNVQKSKILTARSATQLESGRINSLEKDTNLDYKSGSCTNLGPDVGGVAYTNMDVSNTARYINASGEPILQSNEIADLIKKMCDSFTLSQERLLARLKPTCDMQIQCGPDEKSSDVDGRDEGRDKLVHENIESIPLKLETSKSDTCIHKNERDQVKLALSAEERDSIMQKFVNELEDWKEKQQELYKVQLKRKEEYHLELLAKEWAKKRVELESKLSKGIEQCRNLAADLSRATEDFRLRGYRNSEREKKLLEAKKALEAHYTMKYQELREASQKMEEDMNHQLKLKEMRIEELQMKVQQLEKKVDLLKNNLKNVEKEAENKYSGLTKDQTASLIQELRCLEEKLESALQSKAFFKEQWGRAVRELHLAKLSTRNQMLSQLHQDRRQLDLTHMGLETIEDENEKNLNHNKIDLNRLKDDYYVDILTNTPVIESHSMINTSAVDGLEMFDDIQNPPKNPMNSRVNELILQRDKLIQDEEPDEVLLKQLNHEIRSLLLNYGT